MTRTQILLPDSLYKQAKEFSEYQEISLAELVRRGLEMFMRTTAPAADYSAPRNVWTPPSIRPLGTIADPFEDEGWREALYVRRDQGPDRVAESSATEEYRP